LDLSYNELIIPFEVTIMKVYLDRNHCKIDGAACESCFAGRIEKHFSESIFDEMDVGGCVMKIEEEDKHEDIMFYINDRDDKDKLLHVTKDNWPEAYDSWMTLYETQNIQKSK
jgi:hypothetical protein